MDLSNTGTSVSNEQAVNQSVSSGLQYLATQSPTGRAVFKALSERARFRRTTDLRRLFYYVQDKIDSSITEDGFLAVFQELQKLGTGKLIIGRRNNPNRFRWNFNLKEVASAAFENRSLAELSALPNARRAAPQKKARKVRRRRRNRSNGKTVEPVVQQQASAPTPIVTQPAQIPQVQSAPIAPGITINITLPANAKPDDVQAFIDLAKGLQGS